MVSPDSGLRFTSSWCGDGLSSSHLPLRALGSVSFLWLLLVSCNDGTGPDELVGSLAIVPVFESSAAALVPVDRLRVVLLRADSVTVAKDTVFDLVAGQDSVDLAINVALLSASEQFFLEMQLINAAQDPRYLAEDRRRWTDARSLTAAVL